MFSCLSRGQTDFLFFWHFHSNLKISHGGHKTRGMVSVPKQSPSSLSKWFCNLFSLNAVIKVRTHIMRVTNGPTPLWLLFTPKKDDPITTAPFHTDSDTSKSPLIFNTEFFWVIYTQGGCAVPSTCCHVSPMINKQTITPFLTNEKWRKRMCE